MCNIWVLLNGSVFLGILSTNPLREGLCLHSSPSRLAWALHLCGHGDRPEDAFLSLPCSLLTGFLPLPKQFPCFHATATPSPLPYSVKISFSPFTDLFLVLWLTCESYTLTYTHNEGMRERERFQSRFRLGEKIGHWSLSLAYFT